MLDIVSLAPLGVVVLLEIIFLWGSLLAFRGRRWWATWVLLVGSGVQLAGTAGLVAGLLLMVRYFSTVTVGGGGTTMVAPLGGMLMTIGAIVASVGALLFGAGFVGFCGRSGPLEHRAAELEGMLGGLQDRMSDRP